MATITQQVNLSNNLFSDFDFNFTEIPGTKDIAKKNNAEAIKQSVKNILLTNNMERPFDPNFGSQIRQLLFSNWTPLTKINMEKIIRTALEHYEPRIIIQNIVVNDRSINNAIDISLYFIIKNVNTPVTMSLTLERIR